MKIRKVDENLKYIIKSIVKRSNSLDLRIKDSGFFVEIKCPVGTYHVFKTEYLKMVIEISDVKY